MRYLIDTNILVFSIVEEYRISKDVDSILTDYGNRIYVSSASIWEIYILMRVGKLHIKSWKCAKDVFDTIEKELGFIVKYIKKEHLLTFADLEPAKDHGDPFDRMIVAHAITEKIPLISSDRKMQSYKKQGLDFIFNEK